MNLVAYGHEPGIVKSYGHRMLHAQIFNHAQWILFSNL